MDRLLRCFLVVVLSLSLLGLGSMSHAATKNIITWWSANVSGGSVYTQLTIKLEYLSRSTNTYKILGSQSKSAGQMSSGYTSYGFGGWSASADSDINWAYGLWIVLTTSTPNLINRASVPSGYGVTANDDLDFHYISAGVAEARPGYYASSSSIPQSTLIVLNQGVTPTPTPEPTPTPSPTPYSLQVPESYDTSFNSGEAATLPDIDYSDNDIPGANFSNFAILVQAYWYFVPGLAITGFLVGYVVGLLKKLLMSG